MSMSWAYSGTWIACSIRQVSEADALFCSNLENAAKMGEEVLYKQRNRRL